MPATCLGLLESTEGMRLNMAGDDEHLNAGTPELLTSKAKSRLEPAWLEPPFKSIHGAAMQLFNTLTSKATKQ